MRRSSAYFFSFFCPFNPNHFKRGGHCCLSTSCFTSRCSGSTRGPALVMRGQRNRHPGFRHGAGGQGPSKGGQRIRGPETHTKKGINFKFHWQKSLSVPSRLIKLPCDLESPLSEATLPREGRGRMRGRGGSDGGVGGSVCISLLDRANLDICCFCRCSKAKVEDSFPFEKNITKQNKMTENQRMCIIIEQKN